MFKVSILRARAQYLGFETEQKVKIQYVNSFDTFKHTFFYFIDPYRSIQINIKTVNWMQGEHDSNLPMFKIKSCQALLPFAQLALPLDPATLLGPPRRCVENLPPPPWIRPCYDVGVLKTCNQETEPT